MAVFTAIASAIVGAIGLSGVLATIATSVIAGGLAYGTARALGVFEPPKMDNRDPGTSIQLPPATDNKLPILYGQAFTSGPIFDAAISNQNKTMTYCIALSEETQTGTFSCSQVFMNDVELIFTGNTATSHRDPNQSTDTSYNGKVRVNIYQGGSAGSDVIFPTSGTGSSTAASAIVPHWGANHTANAMVFAVLQVDYDAENGLTGLPQMTFKMNNSLNNPGEVLHDYLTSDRYGAGLTTAQLDVPTFTGTANTQMKGYCNELVSYTNNSGASATNARYQINGMLSSFNACSNNIDEICQSSATFFSFNPKKGKFAAIPNRALSSTELANCLVYNDDNIVSKIDISSTELYSLYNGCEVSFMDNTRKDQTNTIKVTTPPADRNSNEPDNTLSYTLNMINDNIRAERLANIDLNQSRVGTVIQFSADFSGIQTDVGDVIKITNSLYSWTDKLFRVMRVTEVQGEAGMITAQISALEYSADYYTVPSVTESSAPNFPDLPRLPVIGPIFIPGIYGGSYGNVSALPSEEFGNVIVNDAMKTFGAGTQLVDNPASANVISSTGTFLDILPAEEVYDISGADIGDYELSASATLGGTVTGAYDVAFRPKITLEFANATNTLVQPVLGNSGPILGFDAAPPPLISNTKVSLDPTSYAGGSADMKPTRANVMLQGFTDVGTSNAAPRSFANMGFEFLRVTKGEK